MRRPRLALGPVLALVLVAVLSAVASALAPAALAQDSPADTDPFAPVLPLAGTWRGESEGFGTVSDVTHRWEPVLDGKFLRLTTRSVPRPAGDAPTSDADPEVHEDVGYVSFSDGDGQLRFHHFLSEGFVNAFLVEPVEPPAVGLDFEPLGTAGMDNFAVRMTLRFDGNDAYEMVLEMGPEDGELKACQTMRLERVD